MNVWQGPFFGRNDKEMLVVGKDGAFLSRDAGTTWKQVASLKLERVRLSLYAQLVRLLRLGPGE